MSLDGMLFILATIVLSVIANLATPSVARFITTTRDARTAASASRKARFDAQVTYFYKHPEVFTQHLLRSVLGTIALLTATVIAVAALVTLGTNIPRIGPSILPPEFDDVVKVLGTLAVVVLIGLSTTAATRRAGQSLDLYRGVRRKRVEAGEWPEDWLL